MSVHTIESVRASQSERIQKRVHARELISCGTRGNIAEVISFIDIMT